MVDEAAFSGDCGWSLHNQRYLYEMDPGCWAIVALNVAHFNMDGDGDSFSLYDGADASALLLGTFTGQDQFFVESTGRSLYVAYTLDGDGDRNGFAALYSLTQRCDDPSLPLAFFTSVSLVLSDSLSSQSAAQAFVYHVAQVLGVNPAWVSVVSVTISTVFLDKFDVHVQLQAQSSESATRYANALRSMSSEELSEVGAINVASGCASWTTCHSCGLDYGCGWCDTSNTCIDSALFVTCADYNFKPQMCPLECGACHSSVMYSAMCQCDSLSYTCQCLEELRVSAAVGVAVAVLAALLFFHYSCMHRKEAVRKLKQTSSMIKMERMKSKLRKTKVGQDEFDNLDDEDQADSKTHGAVIDDFDADLNYGDGMAPVLPPAQNPHVYNPHVTFHSTPGAPIDLPIAHPVHTNGEFPMATPVMMGGHVQSWSCDVNAGNAAPPRYNPNWVSSASADNF